MTMIRRPSPPAGADGPQPPEQPLSPTADVTPPASPPGAAAVARAAGRRLDALLGGTAQEDRARRRRIVEDAAALLERQMPGRPYQDLPPGLAPLAREEPDLARLLVARLLAGTDARLADRRVPEAVLAEWRGEAVRILAEERPDLADDAFRKDLSICLLLSFPCVAQVVEETGGIPRLAALRGGGPDQAVAVARHLARTGFRAGPYLEIHTHTPMLDGFHPAGWERCYRLVAELLRLRPEMLGMVGGSWFYDPALAAISPRLTYLADTPIAGGAFRLRLGASESDRALATATSPTRRRLVEEGRYRPTRWLLVWPREALLRWAAATAGAGAP